MKLFCVEVGFRQARKTCSVTSSIVVFAKSKAAASRYAQENFHDALLYTQVLHVCEATHVFVDWTSGDVTIKETHPSTRKYHL